MSHHIHILYDSNWSIGTYSPFGFSRQSWKLIENWKDFISNKREKVRIRLLLLDFESTTQRKLIFFCEENESSFTWLKNQRLEVKMDLCPVGLKIAPFLKPFYFHFHHNRHGKTTYTEFSALKCKSFYIFFKIWHLPLIIWRYIILSNVKKWVEDWPIFLWSSKNIWTL